MKPDDKFPTERLEIVRRLTTEAGDALDALTSAINGIRDNYPVFMHETTCDWWRFAANAKSYVRRIAEQTKEAADAVAVLMRMIAVVEGKQKLGKEN